MTDDPGTVADDPGTVADNHAIRFIILWDPWLRSGELPTIGAMAQLLTPERDALVLGSRSRRHLQRALPTIGGMLVLRNTRCLRWYVVRDTGGF